MKKILSFLLLCVAAICCLSCENGEDVNVEKKLVDVCFGVKFVESGSMSRATADEVYQEFYDKHIATKELVKKEYQLTIRDMSGATVAELNGTWDVTTIQLPEGTYQISGNSVGDYETVFLRFEEDVEIKSSGTINLTAQYSCYLLLFPTNGGQYSYTLYTKSGMYTDSMALPTVDDLSYLFASSLGYSHYIKYSDGTDQTTLYFNSENFQFEIGKYYYFNIVTGTFNIPPMENGGI